MSNSLWAWLILAGSLLITNWLFNAYQKRLDNQFKFGYERGVIDGRRSREIRK